MPTRRHYLASVAGVTLGAGCLSGGGSGGGGSVPASFVDDEQYLSMEGDTLSVDVEAYLDGIGYVGADGSLQLEFDTGNGRFSGNLKVVGYYRGDLREYVENGKIVSHPEVETQSDVMHGYVLPPNPNQSDPALLFFVNGAFVSGTGDRTVAYHRSGVVAGSIAAPNLTEVEDGLHVASVSVDVGEFYDRMDQHGVFLGSTAQDSDPPAVETAIAAQ